VTRFPTIRKLYVLLPPDERWKLLLLLAAMLVAGVAQVLGLASVMPFIGLVANPNLVHVSPWMHRLFDAGGFTDTKQFLFAMGVAVVAFFALGNALTALTSWFSYRFIWFNQQKMAQRLLEEYLSKPYSFFLTRHGARLGKTLLSEVKVVVTGIVVPGLDVIAKSVSTAFVLGLLIAVDPRLASVVSLSIGSAYGLLYWFARQTQRRIGVRQVKANTTMWRVATEAFGGIKDVKVLGREADFVARFRAPSLEFAAANASNDLVRQLPAYALETIAIGGMLAVLLYLLRVRESLSDVLPLMALYAVAGNRLMPAFHQIFAGLTTIRFNKASLDELYADMMTFPGGARVPVPSTVRQVPPGGSEIRFRDVSFEYPGAQRNAITHIDLLIPPHTTVGLVGSTGSGKTTLVDLLLGLFRPTSGDILIDGRPLDPSTTAMWRSRIGYVPQHIFLCDDTIARNIAFGIPDKDIDQTAVERAGRAASLHEFISRLPDGYKTVVGERGVRLSGGERQRIGIARALYHGPDVVVMDEATSALDTVTEDAVMTATRDLSIDRTVILIAHRLSTVRHCDTIVFLEGGTVAAQGTYDELVERNPSFRAMAGLS
jgi:ABC-type multidrug transport system fused ATPase/permease subunit